MSGKIFINYRREDSSAWAGRLSDHLSAHFPQSQIFMDVDMDLGINFVEEIERNVGSCDVLIAVIGKHWLISTGEKRRRRLGNPNDFVRLEIATALKRNIRVIPVLVDGASMPPSGQLPEDLKQLALRNALNVSHERFRADAERLIGGVGRALESARLEQQHKREEQERLAAEQRESEEKEWLEHVPRSQPPSPDAPSAYPAQPEADKPSAEIPKAVHPAPPKPAESERDKLPLPSSGGIGRESPSKQLIAFLTIVAVLVVAGLIYLATRPSKSPPPQPAPIVAVTPTPRAIATPTVEEKARSAFERATKDHPWVNSLGMKFVPVAETQVLFSIWDTRVEDFEAFVKNTGYDATAGMQSLGKDSWQQRGATWKEPGFKQGPTDPVVGVSWYDAKAFCEWLTKRERGSGALPEGVHYRLPTDEEWSIAVGLDSERGNTPQEKDSKIKLYPWGTQWPPPPGAGNYAGEELRIGNEPEDWTGIRGYNDGYPRTSPVGSFAANKNGLYDMGGNVWQWCEDWYNSLYEYRVVRGGSWIDGLDFNMLSSSRTYRREPDLRYDIVGFRCVVAREASQ
jgi:formylglycine-generating enzyme required for sulfatase activity